MGIGQGHVRARGRRALWSGAAGGIPIAVTATVKAAVEDGWGAAVGTAAFCGACVAGVLLVVWRSYLESDDPSEPPPH
jgi:hypothetical protein